MIEVDREFFYSLQIQQITVVGRTLKVPPPLVLIEYFHLIKWQIVLCILSDHHLLILAVKR
jgi:hypothetical protein